MFDSRNDAVYVEVIKNLQKYAEAFGDVDYINDDEVCVDIEGVDVVETDKVVIARVMVDHGGFSLEESVFWLKDSMRVWGSWKAMEELIKNYHPDAFVLFKDGRGMIFSISKNRFQLHAGDGVCLMDHSCEWKFKGIKEFGRMFGEYARAGAPIVGSLNGLIAGMSNEERREFDNGLADEEE